MEYLGYFLHRADAIICALDELAGDTDREPSLGSVAVSDASDQRVWSQGGDTAEREADGDDRERDGDGPGIIRWAGMESDGLLRPFGG